MTIGELRERIRDLKDGVVIDVLGNEPDTDLQIMRNDKEIIFYFGDLDLETVDTDEFFE